MVTLLIDANLDGQGNLLDARLRTDGWREVSAYLSIQVFHFEQADLDRAAKNDVVWQFCQQHGY